MRVAFFLTGVVWLDGYVRDYEEVSLQTMHRDKSRKEIELSFSAFGRYCVTRGFPRG